MHRGRRSISFRTWRTSLRITPYLIPTSSCRLFWACASFTWVISGGGAMRLCPEAISYLAAADIQNMPSRHRRGTVFHPTHPRTLQTLPNDLATRFRRTAANVPTLLPVVRIIRTIAVVLQVTDQLPQLLPNFGRSLHWHVDGSQPRQQRLATLPLQDTLGLLRPLLACRLVASVPHLGKITDLFGAWIPNPESSSRYRPDDAATLLPGRCRHRSRQSSR
jgi:hypothetical protein